MLNKFKYLILVLIIVSLFLPRPASAILGTGIFDLFDHMLHGISEKTGPMAALIIVTIFFYVVLLLLLWLSGFVLEIVVLGQAEWMAGLQGMTEVGWNFTAGIANLVLIIIFLVIAFAFIFKIETLQAKKSLPRLIIVAILLNFSLLFVNVLVDISQIAYNTILTAMPDQLIPKVITVLVAPLLFSVVAMVVLTTGLIVAWSIPIASAFAQILFAALFIPIILPALALLGIQMLLFSPLALMFLTFVFLFSARVFIIQLLTMVAPLAFICLILPQTKKYWDDWFQNLVQWLLLGIVVLFFLAVGFSALDSLTPGLRTIDVGDVPGPLRPFAFLVKGIVALAVFYFAAFIYLTAILYLSKKYMPAFAGFLIEQGKGVAGNILNMGLKPLGAAAAARLKKGLTESKWVQKKAAKEATIPTPDLRGGKKVLAPGYALRRGLGQALGPGLIEARNRELATDRKKIAEISTPEMFESKYLSARSDDERGNYFAEAMDKGGPFKDILTADKYKGSAIKAVTRANEIGRVPEAEKITRGILDDRLTEADLQKMGFNSYQQIADPNSKDFSQKKKDEWDAKGYKTITDKLVGDVKGNEVKDFSENFWKSPGAMEAIQRFWGGPQISQAANEFGRKFVDDYMQVVNKLTPDQMAVFNPKSAMYLTGNAAQDFGFRAPKGISREKMREKTTRGRPPGYIPSEKELGTLKEKIREVFPERTIITPPLGPEDSTHRTEGPGERGPHSV